MSATHTPDAWKELNQLLETRKQVLDNALARTMDEKCSASCFQVVRHLLLDHEKLLLWFLAQQQRPADSYPVEPITKPAPSPQAQPIRRAGFLKPLWLAVLAVIFFFALILVAWFQQYRTQWGMGENTGSPRSAACTISHVMAHYLHFPGLGCFCQQTCCIMESPHGSECKFAQQREMADAFVPARPAKSHQDRLDSCDQPFPQPA